MVALFISILFALTVRISAQQSVDITIEFDPPAIRKPHLKENGLPWEESMDVLVTIHVNGTPSDVLRTLQPQFVCADEDICAVEPADWMIFDGRTMAQANISITGKFIGKTSLMLKNYTSEPTNVLVQFPQVYI